MPPTYQPPVIEGPPPGTGALSLGLGRGSRERELIRQVGAPLAGTRRVVVLSIKGGVGKTTTVAVTGSLLAGLRRDKVVALDASSDWGTLATRLSVVPRQSVRELAANGRHAVSERGVLAQLAAAPSGLLVVGSDPQTLVSAALTEEEYVQTLRLLEYVGNLIVTDVGAGLQQSFLPAALAGCDQLVVASAATWDAAQSAGAALDWLAARGLSGRWSSARIVVVNNLYPRAAPAVGYIRDIKSDLSRRARAVHEVPFDAGAAAGRADPAAQAVGARLARRTSRSPPTSSPVCPRRADPLARRCDQAQAGRSLRRWSRMASRAEVGSCASTASKIASWSPATRAQKPAGALPVPHVVVHDLEDRPAEHLDDRAAGRPDQRRVEHLAVPDGLGEAPSAGGRTASP